jgi:hypothetical protein
MRVQQESLDEKDRPQITQPQITQMDADGVRGPSEELVLVRVDQAANLWAWAEVEEKSCFQNTTPEVVQ